nr:MAG TPA: hypothetical protein [Caudoviricetes sp.]
MHVINKDLFSGRFHLLKEELWLVEFDRLEGGENPSYPPGKKVN